MPRTIVQTVSGTLRGMAIVGLAIAALGGPARSAEAQGTRFAVVIEGASGEDQYARLHREWLDRLTRLLREQFGFEGDKVVVLADAPKAGESRATAENVRSAFARLAAEVRPEDLVFVMLIGHGAGQGPDAKFNLVGPDLSVADWNGLVGALKGRLAFVNSTSASFPFLAGLAAPGRVVITATNSYAQRYHTRFAEAFIEGLAAAAADADKNGRVSVLEAFTHATRLVGQHYERSGLLATEQAAFDDTGDGAAKSAGAEGPAGDVARLTYLDAPARPASADPEVQKLLDRQMALTAEVDDLRRRRAVLPADLYAREFERLITELSLVSREVRRRTGG